MLPNSKIAIIAVTALVACGCSNVVSGKVDGQSVSGLNGATYVQSSEYLLIWLGGGSCEAQIEYYTEYRDLREDQQVDDLVALWADTFIEDHWQVQIAITGVNTNNDLTDSVILGADYDTLESNESTYATAVLTHYLKYPDVAYLSGEVAAEDHDQYSQAWNAHEGELTVNAHTPNERISGTYVTTAAEVEYLESGFEVSEKGDITIDFSAERCRDLETLVF